MNHDIGLVFSVILSLFAWLGLVLIQAGMVRAKNTTSLLLANISLFALIFLIYYVAGHAILQVESDHQILAGIFSCLVAINIIYAATAERVKLWAIIHVAVLFALIIFPSMTSWPVVASLLSGLQFHNGAGAGTIFLASAVIGGVGAYYLGFRYGFSPHDICLPIRPANLPLCAYGVMCFLIGFPGLLSLWLHAGGDAISGVNLLNLMLKSCVCFSAGFFASLMLSRMFSGIADITLAINGGIGGLVALSAAPNVFDGLPMLIMAALTGLLVILAIRLIERLQIDDPTGVISACGVGALMGLVDEGIFMQSTKQVFIQILGCGVIILGAGLMSLLAWWGVDKLMRLRLAPEEEARGLDLHDCGISAYPEFTTTGK